MENSIGLKRFDYLVGPEAIMDMTDLEVLDVVPRSSDKQAEDQRSVDTEQSGININFAGRLLFSSAEMFKKSLWQTVWTQNRLLL